MTKDEIVKIIFVIRANYPEAYAKLSPNDLDLLTTSWAALLNDYTYEQVSVAVQNYLVNDIYGRAPKIGQIIDSLKKVETAKELNANEAWALVYKAIQNSNYHAEEEFNKLPPIVQKAVGNFNNLKDYAVMNIEDVQVTVKAHFKSIYETESKREKELSKLPQAIRDRIGVNEFLRLEENANVRTDT